MDSLIVDIGILSYPAAFPEAKVNEVTFTFLDYLSVLLLVLNTYWRIWVVLEKSRNPRSKIQDGRRLKVMT